MGVYEHDCVPDTVKMTVSIRRCLMRGFNVALNGIFKNTLKSQMIVDE